MWSAFAVSTWPITASHKRQPRPIRQRTFRNTAVFSMSDYRYSTHLYSSASSWCWRGRRKCTAAKCGTEKRRTQTAGLKKTQDFVFRLCSFPVRRFPASLTFSVAPRWRWFVSTMTPTALQKAHSDDEKMETRKGWVIRRRRHAIQTDGRGGPSRSRGPTTGAWRSWETRSASGRWWSSSFRPRWCSASEGSAAAAPATTRWWRRTPLSAPSPPSARPPPRSPARRQSQSVNQSIEQEISQSISRWNYFTLKHKNELKVNYAGWGCSSEHC